MLINRLGILLAENQLPIKRVVADTGISRNTVSNISNNPSANISTDTINRFCQYFSIQPADFFEYVPFDFYNSVDVDNWEPHYFEGNQQVEYQSAELSVFITARQNGEKIDVVELTGSLENFGAIQSDKNGDAITQVGVSASPKDDGEAKRLALLLKNASPSLLTTLKKQVITSIAATINAVDKGIEFVSEKIEFS